MNLRKRNWQALSTWLFTILLLAGGFGLYSYLYVHQREQYFAEKKLRELRLLGDQLKLRIENIANNILPNAAQNFAISDCDLPADPTLTVYEVNSSAIGSSRKASAGETCGYGRVLDKTRLVPNFTLGKFIANVHSQPASGKDPASDNASPASLVVQTEGIAPTILFTYQSSRTNNDSFSPKWQGQIGAKYLLGQVGSESFDQLVVANEDGDVQFQIGVSRLGITNLRSLVEGSEPSDKSGKAESGTQTGGKGSGFAFASVRDSASVVTVRLAGEDYLSFFQPVKIRLTGGPVDQLNSGLRLKWIIVGLISKDRFGRDSSTFSNTTILIFLFVLLLLVSAEPFIKIASLGPLDRLLKRDVISLFVSAALTIALTTFLAADAYVYSQIGIRIDSQLQKFSEEVRRNFNQDLTDLLRVLKNRSEKPVPGLSYATLVNLLDTPKPEGTAPLDKPCKDEILDHGKSEALPTYPAPDDVRSAFFQGAFFERIVWVDPCGQQRRKWTVYDHTTSLIQVGERTYFQNVKNNMRLSRKEVDGKDVCFWFGPIVSWNTGESLATLSTRGPAAKQQPTRTHTDCERYLDQSNHWVITLDAILPSLRDVTLPPGYGFVIVDSEGTALFHSDPQRHFQENLFEESDQDPALSGAIFGRATEFINVDYLGTGHRVRTVPLDAPPWTLVVFYDKHFLRTMNVEILSAALALFLLSLAVQLPALSILWFRDPRWLWFDEGRQESYPPYLLGALALVTLFSVALIVFSPVSAVFAAFLIPSVLLTATYFKFRPTKSASKAERGIRDGFLSFTPPLIVVLGMLYCCWVEHELFEATILSVGTGLIAVFLLSPRVQNRLKQSKPLSPRTGYRLTMVALLIVLGGLPSLAFFRVAYTNEMALLLKHGQYRLAESLHDREERLRKETLNIPGARSYFDERTNDPMSRDIYGDFFFACSPPVDPAPPSAAANPFGAVLKELRLHLLLDPVVAESQGLFNDGPSDMPPSWLGRDSLCMNLISKPNNGSRLQPGPVQVPTWWEPASKRGYIWAVVLGFGLLEIILWMSRFIAKRVFLIDLENSPEFATPPDVSNFDSIWDECSREEKLALCDFAVDGFLNSRNQSITSLLKRGLLRLYPLQLGDEAFRDPILSKCKDDETLAPAKEETLSWWQKTKWPLLVTLLGLTAFLFFTQRKVFEGGVGFLGAIAAAVTTFFNLFDQVRGGSTKK